MTDLRVGLVGYGLAGRAFHAPVLSAVRGLRLAAVVTRDPERARQAQADWPDAEVLPDAGALSGRVDVVVVATPNRTHVPLARAAVDAGLAVVVDKPLAPTADEAQMLVDHARSAGVLLTVFQNRRWDADARTARRLLDAGALGAPLRLETRFERWRPQPSGGWRESADPDEGGGLLLDLGAHQVDLAAWLLGPVTRVHAELDVRRPGALVEDDVLLALTHTGGARSTHWLSAVCAQPGPRLRLLGDRAALVVADLDPQEAALRAGARPGPGWGEAPAVLLGAGDDVRAVPSDPGDYRLFYAGLRDALRDGAPAPVEAADAVHGLQVLEAARRASAEGAVVALS